MIPALKYIGVWLFLTAVLSIGSAWRTGNADLVNSAMYAFLGIWAWYIWHEAIVRFERLEKRVKTLELELADERRARNPPPYTNYR